MAEIIGEFHFMDGEWWMRDYYYTMCGTKNHWLVIAGEYYTY